MSNRPSKLPRSVLGYQRSEVDRMLAERDAMLGAADGRVRASEARIAALEEQLQQRDTEVETRIAALQEQLEQKDAEAEARLAGEEQRFHDRERPLQTKIADLEDQLHEQESELAARSLELEDARRATPPPLVDDGRAAELEEQLLRRDDEIEGMREELESLRATVAEQQEASAAAASEEEGMTSEFMTEELSRVVAAAEESATRIIERAWSTTRQQITEADRLWREVQAEVIHFGAWRQHVEPKIGTVLGSIDDAKARIEEISERVQEALRPTVEAIGNVDESMADFAQASNVPLLLAPGGLDEARAQVENDEPPKLTAITGTELVSESPASTVDGEPVDDDSTEVTSEYEAVVDYPSASSEG
jgi:chromosome segregation ATPase